MIPERPRASSFRLLRRYLPPVHEDLSTAYLRGLHKWLVIAPLIGLAAGLSITLVAAVIMRGLWPIILSHYLAHHWLIVPTVVFGCALTGLIMQFMTRNPNQHSTEEVIQAYHEHEGRLDMRALPAKLLAAITTVGFGGSAALEGPSIYGGAAVGSWLWSRLSGLRQFGLEKRDRRIMLICGAAAGMSAVFRAPLTGIVFALEMPYKDDLAHEALLPSLIASVVSYVTLGAFLGNAPLFELPGAAAYRWPDLLWSAVLGLTIGLIALTFVTTFRRLRQYVVRTRGPHWIKLSIGGFATGICGLLFLHLYPGNLVPIGPNYEAVQDLLIHHHPSTEIVMFCALKLVATAATLGAGGVSAMFVPLFLTGEGLGVVFAQSVLHTPSLALYAAVGMASFIAAAYKTPLAAVVFVAEAAGGHAFIIPALVASAVAYAISGDASTSTDQIVQDASRRSYTADKRENEESKQHYGEA